MSETSPITLPVTFLMFDAFGHGGVARTVLNLASRLADHRDVRVVSLHGRAGRPAYPLDPRVRLEVLIDVRRGPAPVRRLLQRRATRLTPVPAEQRFSRLTDLALRRCLRRLGPGTLVSTRPSLHLAATRWAAPGVRLVGQDHKNFPTRFANPRQAAVLRAAVPALDAYVVLTHADAEDYRRELPGLRTRVEVIRNALPWDLAAAPAPLDAKVVVAAGRLVREKGFERLVDAFAPVARAHPDWQLHIHGEGAGRVALQRRVHRLGLDEQVLLPGYAEDFRGVLAGASAYALTSRAEGFPMVLIEAMSAGVPLVAMDCPRGPGEIVDDGKNGFLVADGDVPGFTRALTALVEDDELRRRCGRRAMVDAMAPRVYLHVGVPKSGTTFLQASLAGNRKALREAGVLYPGGHERMFLAAVDVRGAHKAWGRRRVEVEGTWDALCRKARSHDGPTVISHELLAAASAHQVTAALTMLRGVEVHVVVTARDPARQATAEWQEGIKHGRRLTFEEFRRRVLDGSSETDYARRFRASQDLPAVLSRWGGALPAERVHVVCCPPPSADPGLLWQRFGDVVGFDAGRFAAAGPDSANGSLGVPEIDLLRRVNLALDKRLVQPEYGQVVKQLYAQQLLAARRSPRPVVPAEMHDDLTVVGERWVKEIDQAGWTVHGDPAELLPAAPAGPAPHPDDVDPRAQVDSAAAATAELLLEVHRCRAEIARLEGDKAELKKRRKVLKRRLKKATAD